MQKYMIMMTNSRRIHLNRTMLHCDLVVVGFFRKCRKTRPYAISYLCANKVDIDKRITPKRAHKI